MTCTKLFISRLGHQGDGIAETAEGPVYVSGALPGEEVHATISKTRGSVVDILTSSPDRVDPLCRHFSVCGGCTTQHLAEPAYLEWKRQIVVQALKSHAIDGPVSAVHSCPAQSRRRAVFSIVRAGKAVLLGYHEKASHRLVGIRECPVLVPEITAALAGLHKLAGLLLPRRGELRLTVLATPSGLDAAFENTDKDYERRFADLSRLAIELDLARLSVNGETVLEQRPPTLDIGGLAVVAPPAAFVQATEGSETMLAQLVQDGVIGAKRVADLFAGLGTFGLRIAQKAAVHAVEGNANALKAFDQALRKHKGLKKVTLERRDLFRRPLMPAELNAFDAIVFDPPRAGAKAQADHIANSAVPTVIAVSCNPATLARDLKILIDGGYRLENITPVDQFLFSPHVECVARLSK